MGSRLWRVIALPMVCLTAACEFDARVVAPTARRDIVHSVLNPSAPSYAVLVEELLTGRVSVDKDVPFREDDPIATGSGIPIGGAQVVMFNESGDSAVGFEIILAIGLANRSTGVYRFQNVTSVSASALRLFPGARYYLRVTTPAGDVITGSTVIPDASSERLPESIRFNRDTDTLRLAWARARGAKSYLIRVNSPRGPYHIFTDSLNIRLPGSLRNFFAEYLPSVFVPGFTQTLQLSAIDSNFYDYYRSANNPFTGTGLINHLRGGSGLFGALVPLETRSLVTVANQDEPIEGEYLAELTFASGAPNRLTLYVESQRGPLAQITGNYDRQSTIEGGGVIGFKNGSAITLAFLNENLASDTLSTFAGTLYGSDSIVGTIRSVEERIVYRKQ